MYVNGLRTDMLLSTLTLIFSTSSFTEGKDMNIAVTTSCSYQTMNPNEYTTYVIKWNGVDPGADGCTMKFQGSGGEGSAYVVCVEASRYYVQGPGIYLTYKSNDGQIMRYGVNEFPDNFCTEPDSRLKIIVNAEQRSYGRLRMSTSKSYFTLKVTAKPTQEDKSLPTSAILAIVGGVIAVAVAIIAYIRCKTDARKHHVEENENAEENDPRSRELMLHSHGESERNERHMTPHRVPSPLHVYSDQLHTSTHNYSTSSSEGDCDTERQPDFNYPTSTRVPHGDLSSSSHTNTVGHNVPSAPPMPSYTNDYANKEIPPPSYQEVMNNR